MTLAATFLRADMEVVAALALGRPPLAVQKQPAAVLAAERAPDGVATVLTDDGACLLHLEFETSVKPAELPRRMAHAGWLLHGPKEGLPVRGVAVLLDPRPGLPTSYAMQHGDDVLGTYSYRVVALSALDVEALLDAPAEQAGLLALVPLAGGATTQHVARAAERLRALNSPDAADLAVISLMRGRRKFGYDDLVRIFRKEFLMLGDVWPEVEKEGFDKGIVKGRQEGRHEAARAALHTFCTARFGAALDAALDAVPDPALNDAIAAIAVAPDAASAAERLGRLGGG